MTHDEIIKQLESLLAHCKSMIEKDGGFPIWEKDCEALEAAIAALRPTNEPLTLEQIQKVPHGKIKDSTLKSICNRANEIAYPSAKIDREKWKPCELCKRIDEVDPCYKDGCFRKNAPECDFRCDKFLDWRADRKKLTGAAFCPECGRPLTEEAWAELEKRIRG